MTVASQHRGQIIEPARACITEESGGEVCGDAGRGVPQRLVLATESPKA